MNQVPGRGDRSLLAIAFAAGAVLLGHALQLNNGNLNPDALGLLTATYVLAMIGVAAPALGRWDRMTGPVLETVVEPLLVAGLTAALAWQVTELLTAPPGYYLRSPPGGFAPFVKAVAAAGVLAGASAGRLGRLRWLQVPAVLVAFLFAGVWLIHASPSPFIDVYVFHRDSVNALLSGHNPYSITFPNIYGHGAFYGEGLVENGRLNFGFPYPPLSLFISVVGQLFGDYRYANLGAMVGAAALMAFARPGPPGRGSPVGALAAWVYLLTPRAFFVLEQGWTESYVVLGLAAVVFVACRAPRALPYVLGLFLALKQHLVLGLPLAWLLLPRPVTRRAAWTLAWKAVVVAAAVTVPMALLDLPGFWRAVVLFQIRQPFRMEALSYLAWFARDGGPRLPVALGFLALVAGIALALWRAPRTPAGFAAGYALAYLGFFAFNKQAFCNYYYFVVGACCVAAASVDWRAPAADAVAREPTTSSQSSAPEVAASAVAS